MSDAPKSLAQLCHLQDSALAFLPFPKKGGATSGPSVRCLAGYLVQPATHLDSPGY